MKPFRLFLWLLVAALLAPAYLSAQRNMTVEDLSGWKRITDPALSHDGKQAGCRIAPWQGDGAVHLFTAAGREVAAYTPADQFVFSSSSQYALVRKVPGKQLTDSLKLKKTKSKDMPMNALVVRHVSGNEEVIDSLKSYKLAESADWLAYQQGKKDSALHVRSLDGSRAFRFPAVKEYRFAKKSGRLFYVSVGDTLGTAPGLYLLDPEKEAPALLKEGKGEFRQVTFDEPGDKLAFLYCAKKDSVYNSLTLWLSGHGAPARLVADRTHSAFPAGWVISEHGRLQFSKNSERLFLGTSPEPRQKDTARLAEYHPQVQVWNWNEHTQYTVQDYERKNDLKKNYRAVVHIPEDRLLQLSTVELPSFTPGDEGNAELALLWTTLPYPVVSMWEGSPRRDYYTVSLATGEKKLLRENHRGGLSLSPGGTYAYWYAASDSSWYAVSLVDGKEIRLTDPRTFAAWNEDEDVPDHPSAYGIAGWTTDDKYLLLYDRYDIWRVDPRGVAPTINLTKNGRATRVRYRLLWLDKEERFVDTGKPCLLRGFDETTKGSGYYRSRLSASVVPETLLAGDYLLNVPLKAKDADVVLYTSETFGRFPELLLSGTDFKKTVQLTRAGDQQAAYHWGTAELVRWVSLDGIPLEGLLYKPAGFDPKKKYPMIVNFYERSSDDLYRYRLPQPHRSTIDYHLYTGNGYLVFNPDVRYRDGYPGESCYNCVMPGISRLIETGYVDEQAIGAQGHSWGGYQVAYLATRTNLFAAISSGAPVVNMFSAYGGIRWGSGRNRSFQYERGQSRIGATPWEAPLKYVENSPLFTMDKVTASTLIMHNDADGHVPWYQGIEYFIALKRLQKPVWMLNYTGEIHWPEKMANRIDFQHRMYQFFNHYLKKEPMPQWMEEGVKAVDREFETGY